MSHRIIYSVSGNGHRTLYANCLSAELYATTLIANPSIKTLLILVLKTKPVVFATIEDSFLFFVACSMIRSTFGKKTIGISLEAGDTAKSSSVKSSIKNILLSLLDKSVGSRIYTIIPQFINPGNPHSNADWIYDPAFWDLCVKGTLDTIGRIPDAKSLLPAALGDKGSIILYLGSIDPRKGFGYYVDFVQLSKDKGYDFRFIAAGYCGPGARPQDIARYVDLGGVLLNRRLTEEEVLFLQSISDIFWAHYHPSFDQSSGVAGRGFQLGKTLIVREGSIAEKLLKVLGGKFVSSRWGMIDDLPYQINSMPQCTLEQSHELTRELLRRFSTEKLREAL